MFRGEGQKRLFVSIRIIDRETVQKEKNSFIFPNYCCYFLFFYFTANLKLKIIEL